ncbi:MULTISPECIES: hypothetical protein [Clostridium]|uniref:Uncharacterized protein n=1 Tax=Clostridium disporicum TaxID=84024 RepID=A0A174GHG4_9CLOT|nr:MULTISPECIES: hypothetical protein [Clostridium]MCD2500258.1 hypothetical protein [Clostridium sp. NSJ-145]CUO60319.1 Uncharacterised protein [Clostridium disporicum]
MHEEVLRLLNQYKETEALMNQYINLLDEKDYAQGKIDLIKTIIADLESLLTLSK